MKQSLVSDVEALIRQAAESGEAAGIAVLVLRDGKECLFAAQGCADRESGKPMERRSLFRLYSQTKPVTAAAVMKLAEQGALDLLDEVQRYLPAFRAQKVLEDGRLVSPARPLTVMDLLGMQSGLPYPDADMAGQVMGKLFAENEHLMDEGRGMSTQAFASAMAECPLAFQPGAQFRYGTSADVLGAVVEQAGDMPFDEYLHRYILDPLGMEDTDFFVPPEKKDRLVTCYERTEEGLRVYHTRHLCVRDAFARPAFCSGGAGLFSTLDDYAAFADMLMHGGMGRGGRILSERTVDWMTRAQVADTQWANLTGYGYGRLMRVCLDPGKTTVFAEKGEYGWDGWLGTYFANLPASGLTFLIFQNTKDTGTGCATRVIRNRIYTGLGGEKD